MISIIGAGRVGSSIAFLCVSNALDDVMLIDRTKDDAIGESLDLANAIPSTSKFSIDASDDFWIDYHADEWQRNQQGQ